MQREAHDDPGVTSRLRTGRREKKRKRKERKRVEERRKEAIVCVD